MSRAPATLKGLTLTDASLGNLLLMASHWNLYQLAELVREACNEAAPATTSSQHAGRLQ